MCLLQQDAVYLSTIYLCYDANFYLMCFSAEMFAWRADILLILKAERIFIIVNINVLVVVGIDRNKKKLK